MKGLRGTPVSVCERLGIPIRAAWQTLRDVTGELQSHPGAASLRLSLPPPFEAFGAVPVEIAVSPGSSRYELEIDIRANAHEALFPHFRGVLWLVHTFGESCDLRLEGKYTVPFRNAGRVADATLLRDAATASLQQFAKDLALTITDRTRIVS